MASLVSGDETDSDDDDRFVDNNKQKEKLKQDVDELRKNPKVGRRGLRQRSLDQSLRVQKVPENGHCLYIAILRATRDKGLLPGSVINTGRWMDDVLKLRQEMITYLMKGKGEVVRNLIAANMFASVLQRIQAGITRNNTLKPSVSREDWGGGPEIDIMTNMYDLEYVLLQKENAIKGVIGNKNMTPSTAILVYSNGNHYEWATVCNWTTMMTKTPAQVQIKF